MNKVLAIIVTFNPQKEKLISLIESISNQVTQITIVNNGDSGKILPHIKDKKISIIEMNGNHGIAKALNAGVQYAKIIDSDFIVTFDQDSIAAPNHISELIKIWKEKTKLGIKVGGIGPYFYDLRDQEISPYPFYKKNKLIIKKIFPDSTKKCTECDILITSGMLIKTDVLLKHKFLEDLFIDFVDTEWCFRTASYGYKHFGSFQTGMQHELSDEKPKKIFGLTFLKYSIFRRYYFFRNSVLMVKINTVPPIYKIKIFISSSIRFFSIPFTDKLLLSSIKASLNGIKDGINYKI